LLSNGVLHGAAGEVADALLEVLDVFLVGAGDFVDLVWEVLVTGNKTVKALASKNRSKLRLRGLKRLPSRGRQAQLLR
jgi:hypothetical protein